MYAAAEDESEDRAVDVISYTHNGGRVGISYKSYQRVNGIAYTNIRSCYRYFVKRCLGN